MATLTFIFSYIYQPLYFPLRSFGEALLHPPPPGPYLQCEIEVSASYWNKQGMLWAFLRLKKLSDPATGAHVFHFASFC